MADLRLVVKRIYFEQIKSGEKREEYRLINDYWVTRLFGKHYKNVVITLGYPKAGDSEKEIVFPWHGYYRKNNMQHPHFGAEAVDVFAIILKRTL